MAKRRSKGERGEPGTIHEYVDAEGNVLRLRGELSRATIRKIGREGGGPAASGKDVWQRRTEMLFEHLAVSWEIAGLPLDEQKLLLGRYRMADDATRRWVQRTLAEHVERHIPELAPPPP